MSTENTQNSEATQEVKVKRGRGRPKGSKNKPKATPKSDTPKIATVLEKTEVAAKTETTQAARQAAIPVTSKVKVVVTDDEPIVESVE